MSTTEFSAIGWVAHGIELFGVVVIVTGAAWSTVSFSTQLYQTKDFNSAYGRYRANLGRAILLGLEFLVAGDIIATILVEPTIASASALGIIVLIRTFLSFSLETEIEGCWPWERARLRNGNGSRLPSRENSI
jgi:uncharacterized membrane protein